MLKKVGAICAFCATLACGADLEQNRQPSRKKFWLVSLAALGAASVLDIQSSWGRPELNPLLRSPDGRFGARGVQIKAGIVGGAVAFQWLVLRNRPDLETSFGGVNTGLAAWTAGVAVRNYRSAAGRETAPALAPAAPQAPAASLLRTGVR